MTPDDFRRIALSLPDTEERQHMGTPDFRVGGKIFATLGGGEGRGVVMLTPEQQEMLCEAEPAVFSPVPGGWGRSGGTRLELAAADAATLTSALSIAWRKRAPAKLAAAHPDIGARAR